MRIEYAYPVMVVATVVVSGPFVPGSSDRNEQDHQLPGSSYVGGTALF